MPVRWVIAADKSRARIFQSSERDQHLEEIEDLLNPQARVAGRDTEAGAAAAPKVDPFGHEDQMFSKRLCRYLEQARNEQRFDKLCLVAAPAFLGMIRQEMGKELQKLVDQEIAKDVTRLPIHELELYLRQNGYGRAAGLA